MAKNGTKAVLSTALGVRDVRTAHRDVTERLRGAIISGKLPGGTRLVQADLAENLNVSITPVREALRDLVAQGLVHEDPFRGATVHEVSLEELEEVYQLRCLLLPLAIRDRVATISDEQLTVAERMARAMDVEMDDQAWVDANRDFHRALDATSDRLPHLQMILSRLADISALYIALSITSNRTRRQRACKDHLALVKAYRARDAERAVEIAIRHFEDTASAARTYLTERVTAAPQ